MPGNVGAEKSESEYLPVNRFQQSCRLVQDCQLITFQPCEVADNSLHSFSSPGLHKFAASPGRPNHDLTTIECATQTVHQARLFEGFHDTRDGWSGDHLDVGKLTAGLRAGKSEYRQDRQTFRAETSLSIG